MQYYDPSKTNVIYKKVAAFVPPTLKNHYEKVKVKEPFYF